MAKDALAQFGTSIFSEMSRLAVEHDAINLSQGFPDFDGPQQLTDAAIDALRTGHNQYARSMGHPALVAAVAAHQARFYGLTFDPLTEVAAFAGATEGIAAAVLGLLNPGDEVILFEPFYDSYPATIAMAGGVARVLTLRFPDFALDVDALARLFTDRTRLLLLNSPHNPSGKVFTRAELDAIAALAHQHDVVVLSDEVYEHLTYDAAVHVPIATLPGMRERTLTLGSAGKTLSMTGWKCGWATGPRALVARLQAAHQFLTFCGATPLHVAVARTMTTLPAAFYAELRAEYTARRDLLADALTSAGFRVALPQGAYFIVADFAALSDDDDQTFARRLVRDFGVAAIPPSPFYSLDPGSARSLLRFAFCKKMETLTRAGERLAALNRRVV